MSEKTFEVGSCRGGGHDGCLFPVVMPQPFWAKGITLGLDRYELTEEFDADGNRVWKFVGQS